LVNSNQGIATNVTSVGGDRMNTLGTLMIANQLAKMAETETKPELRNYYAKMAELSFYLGGAEGELDNVPGLNQDVPYCNGDALRDVVSFSQELQSLINHPPENVSKDAVPLAAEVFNIAQSYKTALSQYILPDGSVVDLVEPLDTAQQTPGNILTRTDLITGDPPSGISYSQVINYTELQKQAQTVLTDNKVESVPVEVTLQDATQIKSIATQFSPP
jgi:hypothetical protein